MLDPHSSTPQRHDEQRAILFVTLENRSLSAPERHPLHKVDRVIQYNKSGPSACPVAKKRKQCRVLKRHPERGHNAEMRTAIIGKRKGSSHGPDAVWTASLQ